MKNTLQRHFIALTALLLVGNGLMADGTLKKLKTTPKNCPSAGLTSSASKTNTMLDITLTNLNKTCAHSLKMRNPSELQCVTDAITDRPDISGPMAGPVTGPTQLTVYKAKNGQSCFAKGIIHGAPSDQVIDPIYLPDAKDKHTIRARLIKTIHQPGIPINPGGRSATTVPDPV